MGNGLPVDRRAAAYSTSATDTEIANARSGRVFRCETRDCCPVRQSAHEPLEVRRDALRRLDIVRGNRLCGSAVGGILARPYARHIGLAGGLVVAFLLRPIVVDSEATSLFHRRSLVALLAIDRQAIGCLDREKRHGLAFPLGVANTLGRPRLRSDGSRAAERGRSSP
jgi:hypothetical protein